MEREFCGVRVHYEQRGTGKDILLLHGWGCSTALFAPLIDALSPLARVTAIDFPGHGQSGKPPEPWGVPDFARMIEQLITALGIAPCAIVAHSFGGRVAIVLAAEKPELVTKLVLTGAAGLRKPQTSQRKLRGGLYKFLRGACDLCEKTHLFGDAPQNMREKLRKRFGSADYNALDADMRQTFVKVINQDLREYLPRIGAPTLLYWGTQDTETPLWMGQAMEHEIPDAGLVTVEGTHFAYIEHAQEFARIVAHFLLEDNA